MVLNRVTVFPWAEAGPGKKEFGILKTRPEKIRFPGDQGFNHMGRNTGLQGLCGKTAETVLTLQILKRFIETGE